MNSRVPLRGGNRSFTPSSRTGQTIRQRRDDTPQALVFVLDHLEALGSSPPLVPFRPKTRYFRGLNLCQVHGHAHRKTDSGSRQGPRAFRHQK